MKSKSTALEAAENIGAMVKHSTRSSGKSMYKKPAKDKDTKSKTVSKKAEEANKPQAQKPVAKPAAKAKPAAAPKTAAKKTAEKPMSKPPVKYNTPAVDLSFDKPSGFKVTDKRVK